MKKGIRLVSLSLALVLIAPMFAACSQEADYPPALPESTATPPPAGDGAEADFTAELYFVSEDGRKLYPEEHTLAYGTGTSRAEAAIDGLLAGPESALLRRSVPEGLYLEHVELSLDVCNVYFTGEFPAEIRSWLTARAAIAATVYAAEGIESVNVFFNGVEPGYNARPLGAISRVSDALDVYLKNMEQEYEVIPTQTQGEAVAYETHAATLYFTDVSRMLLVARTAELTYPVNASAADMVRLLFNKLLAGDSAGGENSLEPVLPAGISIVGAPEFYYYGGKASLTPGSPAVSPTPGANWEESTETDAPPESPPVPQDIEKIYILDLTLGYGPQGADIEELLMCAALTMTLTSYIPGLDGVRISILEQGGTRRPLCEDYFERTDFRGVVGCGVTLYYPDEEGLALLEATRIVPSASVYDPELRLRELLAGPADPGVAYAAFTADDLAGVYVSNGTAVVDWKAGFSEKLREMIATADSPIPGERRELMFVYGVINTLAELPYVERVWMLEDGKKLGAIAELYLGNPLVKSPGLVSEE
ncbi:MAG TPA: GerMN domain-containing protein [Clostridia bacterium]|nr:GerMN domain-containing protein [Clostridia bacterium]